jgi:hypothetical protein
MTRYRTAELASNQAEVARAQPLADDLAQVLKEALDETAPLRASYFRFEPDRTTCVTAGR